MFIRKLFYWRRWKGYILNYNICKRKSHPEYSYLPALVANVFTISFGEMNEKLLKLNEENRRLREKNNETSPPQISDSYSEKAKEWLIQEKKVPWKHPLNSKN